jgi:fatty acid synthase subunit alpha, fungi type
MKSIFPSFIDGDLLKLVHLSNSFKILDGAKQLKAGDAPRKQKSSPSLTPADRKGHWPSLSSEESSY